MSRPMARHEIHVDGRKVASVVISDPRELLAHVAMVRAVVQEPVVEIVDGETFKWYPDADEFGGVEITSKLIWQRR